MELVALVGFSIVVFLIILICFGITMYEPKSSNSKQYSDRNNTNLDDEKMDFKTTMGAMNDLGRMIIDSKLKNNGAHISDDNDDDDDPIKKY